MAEIKIKVNNLPSVLDDLEGLFICRVKRFYKRETILIIRLNN